jgi:hypothetical protein
MARGSSQPGRDQRQVERRLHPARGLGGRQGVLAICTNRNLKIKCRFGLVGLFFETENDGTQMHMG